MSALPPWSRLPKVACERCDQQAIRRVSASGLVDVTREEGSGPINLMLTDEPGVASVLTCEDHVDTLMDEMVAITGACGAPLLRETWRWWLLNEFYPFRWIGLVETAAYNTAGNRLSWAGVPVWAMARDFIEEFREARRCRAMWRRGGL